MGVTKTEGYSDKINDMATILKALGHPGRLAIVEYLSKVEGCICTDIIEELPLSQPTISRHLRVLKSAGIIQGSVASNSICYCLKKETLFPVLNQLKEWFKENCKLDCSTDKI